MEKEEITTENNHYGKTRGLRAGEEMDTATERSSVTPTTLHEGKRKRKKEEEPIARTFRTTA